MQIRGLEHVSLLSLLGTLGMLTALAVACVKLLLMPSQQPSPVHPEPDHAGPMIMLIALCNIIFACECLIFWGYSRVRLLSCKPIIFPGPSTSRGCRQRLHLQPADQLPSVLDHAVWFYDSLLR